MALASPRAVSIPSGAGRRAHTVRTDRAQATVGPPPDAPTVRVIIGTDRHSVAVVYEVDMRDFYKQEDTRDSSQQIAEWVVRNGRELFRTSYSWAYGVGGEV